MKKLTAVLLALVLMLSMASFASADEEEFDSDLLGSWTQVSEEKNSDVTSSIFDDMLFEPAENLMVFPEGVVSLDDEDFLIEAAYGLPTLTFSAQNGETDLAEQYVAYLEDLPELAAEAGLPLELPDYVLDEMEKVTNIKTTYEIFDLEKEAVENHPSFKNMETWLPYYEENSNDGLRIHITAEFKENPLKKTQYDAVYTYARVTDFDSADYMKLRLLGDWEDSMGNTWSFQSVPAGDGEFDYTVKLNSDGVEYVTDRITTSWAEPKTIWFNFESVDSTDYIDSPHYEIVSAWDENEVVFSSEEGELVLTRVS